jgi:hypothetical protein
MSAWQKWGALVALVAISVGLLALWVRRGHDGGAVRATVGEIQTVHAEVTIGEREVRGVALFSVGDRIRVGKDGRARLRLDDGTTAVVDRGTELVVTDKGLGVNEGRIFVLGGRAAHTEIAAGSLATRARDRRASAPRHP